MKARLLKESLVAALLLTFISILVNLIPFKSEFLRPIKQGISDFDVYDLHFNGRGSQNLGIKDPNIIIIQAAVTREKIAEQINNISKMNPTVIGVDLSFKNDKNFESDLPLKAAILTNPKLVQGYIIENNTISENFIGKQYLKNNGGYMNFSYNDSLSVIRNFKPFFKINATNYNSFTSKILQKFSPERYNALRSRNNIEETINYSGNLNNYIHYSENDFVKLIASKQLKSFEGKIVLLGVFSSNDGSIKTMEDYKFSPMNDRIHGKSLPDIYGVVIHANILSMMLGENNYVNQPATYVSFVISFFLILSVFYLIFWFHLKFGHPMHFMLLFLQIFSVIFSTWIFLKLFDWFDLKINIIPMILSLVISIEMYDIYIKLALWLNKKWQYKTIFTTHH